MIYGYTLWSNVFTHIMKELPHNSIKNISDFNRIKRDATKDDFIFFLALGRGAHKLHQEFHEKNFNLYPNPDFSLFIASRIEHLKEVDKITRFPLKRQGYDSLTDVSFVPNLSEQVVMKVGNFHCGENKWLLKAGTKVPVLKYKLRNEPVLFEEFVPNGRSIRIGIVGDPNKEENFFISEHKNSEYAKYNPSTSWIKNIAPIEKTYLYHERAMLNIPEIDELIEETRNIAIRYNSDLIGIDWVISEEKIGLLELNDMIGIPDDERVLDMFRNHTLQICKQYIENNTL
ncbi:hypothetical protein CON36_31665 [Bacillus cereus]|uniref:ATP-grasp domain-containing protein n=1 Tax=Bacillus cereus TaxID=1396 RepID=A0A9X6STW2_BACCE|nr:hypothetical protein [Bacillus cereus]PDZ94831.1 hypothetical protein CON36_31665 [Bacillus cereus]PGP14521.1 hypothetical protein COA01_29600 [Bacillus cereus]